MKGNLLILKLLWENGNKKIYSVMLIFCLLTMSNIENLCCLICTDVAQDAMETCCCGQLMCSQCSSELKEKNANNKCPNCRKNL